MRASHRAFRIRIDVEHNPRDISAFDALIGVTSALIAEIRY
jgi:hypothetical protein